jgi:hypothetical protein
MDTGIEKTAEYLMTFFSSKYELYHEMMRDAGSSHYPEAFNGESDVIQAIRDMVHNISDNYSDLSVPTGFPSPVALLGSLEGFGDMANRHYEMVEQIRIKNGGHYFSPIDHALDICREIKQAIDYALTLSDYKNKVQEAGLPFYRLKNILERLPIMAKQLESRRNENNVPRETLSIKDEYDVQDLLRAALSLDFDDIRTEEWIPSYAGAASRADFLLKNEKIFIEVKKTRNGLGDKELGKELIIDIAHYRHHPDCHTLVCYIWDDQKRIKNPAGLIFDIEGTKDLNLKVIIV